MTSQLFGRLVTLAALAATAAILVSCPNDESVTDCSRRQQPTHWNGKEWTCRR